MPSPSAGTFSGAIVAKYCALYDLAPKKLAKPLLDRFQTHAWPGNVRELENVIERAVLLAEDSFITESSFPRDLNGISDTPAAGGASRGYSIKVARREMEKRMIIRALEATAGNRSQAARLLEISHPSLLSKIKTYGIDYKPSQKSFFR